MGTHQHESAADGDRCLAIAGKHFLPKYSRHGNQEQTQEEEAQKPKPAMHLVPGTEGQETNKSNPHREASMGHVIAGHTPQENRCEGDQYGKEHTMNKAEH
jgi:hypothetical protein